MSGSGGYYKYRCKYFFTHNCPHWVWVHNAPCAHCLADGRDLEVVIVRNPFRLSREIRVPQLENGALQYIIMNIAATCDADSGWSVRDHPIHSLPATTGPSVVGYTASDGLDYQKHSKNGMRMQSDGIGWAIRSSNFD
ncbi:Uncharacterized protein BP5553_04750 [Venustampulla echinocandica]|uniref:Uncharacterized protein n=1 Tax=Venustampulla echinocandica TaxID=2656787 RepID=A0A370TP71_9HELO|nr:Uncharacterized protein BP5553_04750 [Venustampulla echinocandica]RDL37317.1 Uncharacterized protein BP5553_04750 [Venustampulla echinocandica]